MEAEECIDKCNAGHGTIMMIWVFDTQNSLACLYSTLDMYNLDCVKFTQHVSWALIKKS